MSNHSMLKGRISLWLAIIGVLVVSALLFAACAPKPAAPAAAAPTVAPTDTPMPTEASTTAITSTTETTSTTSSTTPMTSTESMTSTSGVTSSTEVTSSGEMTSSTGMTNTGEAAALSIKVYEDVKLGKVLVDGKGMVIYVFDKDTTDKSNCSGDCLKNWPPVTVSDESAKPTAGEGVTASLGTITRDDGAYQVTVNGMPAYYFAKDTMPNESNGQGVGSVWWVIAADGSKVTTK
jgi:predicted lipoprotein with Yx(FWY)xxD motif